MTTIHVTSEFTPLAHAGGLGDMLFGLAQAQSKKASSVIVLMPFYRFIKDTKLAAPWIVEPFTTTFDEKVVDCRLVKTSYDGVLLYLVESKDDYFASNEIYDKRELERFAFFAASIRSLFQKNLLKADLLHLHDWPGALLSLFTEEAFLPPMLLTIHNLAHQGVLLKQELIKLKPSMQIEQVNALREAIVRLPYISTVSPTYVKQILHEPDGMGLSDVLQSKKFSLRGILNGIHHNYWNPMNDACLEKFLDLNKKNLSERKQVAKKHLLTSCGLAAYIDKPLCATVSRLVPQKGLDLLELALHKIPEWGGIYLLLGHSHIDWVQRRFSTLHLPEHSRLFFEKSEELARLFFMAADFFLIPSIFEPCGLTQMISMRYGCIPIARRTGGLNDTVFDLETSNVEEKKRNGFTFDDNDENALKWGVERAFSLYYEQPADFQLYQDRCSKIDFSWKHSACSYEQLYEEILNPLERKDSFAKRA